MSDIPQNIPDVRREGEKKKDPDVARMLSILEKEYGDLLGQIRVDIKKPEHHKMLTATGGYFWEPREEEPKPTLVVVEGDDQGDSQYADIKEKRKISATIVAEKLGLNFEELSPRVLKIFILAHEIGHASDFVNNYKDAQGWRGQIQKEMFDLPIPHIVIPRARGAFERAGGDIEKMIEELKEIDDFDEKVFRRNLTDQYGGDIKKMLDDQEVMYKKTGMESKADNFAVSFLKEHWEELGLDKK